MVIIVHECSNPPRPHVFRDATILPEITAWLRSPENTRSEVKGLFRFHQLACTVLLGAYRNCRVSPKGSDPTAVAHTECLGAAYIYTLNMPVLHTRLVQHQRRTKFSILSARVVHPLPGFSPSRPFPGRPRPRSTGSGPDNLLCVRLTLRLRCRNGRWT
jgi:hypothetical protein